MRVSRYILSKTFTVALGVTLLFLLALAPEHGPAKYFDSKEISGKDVLEAAAENRVDFIRIISELTRIAPTLVWPQQLYDYILCLDELELLGQKHGMQSWGPSPVKDLAYVLTEQALKWIRFDSDPKEVIDSFIKWGKDDVVQIAINSHHAYLKGITDPKTLQLWHQDVGYMIQQIRLKKCSPYVLESAFQLQAKIVIKVLDQDEELETKLLASIIETIESQTAAEQVAAYLIKNVYKENSVDRINSLLFLSELLSQSINRQENLLPSNLKEVAGDITIEIARKILYLSENPDLELLVAMIKHLQAKHLGDFVHLFSDFRWDLLKSQQAALFNSFATHLGQQFKGLHLDDQQYKLKRLKARFSTMIELSKTQLEGTYSGNFGKSKATLTVVASGGTFTLASLRISQELDETLYHQDFGFTDFYYNEAKASFELQRILVDDPRYGIPDRKMYYMSFSIPDTLNSYDDKKDNGPTLDGVFFHAGKQVPFTMKKTESYPAYHPNDNMDTIDISGFFSNAKYSLSISRVNEQVAASLFVNEFNTQIHFNFGRFNEANQTVYLSSGEQKGGRTVYIRAHFLGQDEVSLSYIIGGKGLGLDPMTLTRNL